jgi:hypothetical protein
MLAHLEGIMVRTNKCGELSGLWGDDAERIVDDLIEALAQYWQEVDEDEFFDNLLWA